MQSFHTAVTSAMMYHVQFQQQASRLPDAHRPANCVVSIDCDFQQTNSLQLTCHRVLGVVFSLFASAAFRHWHQVTGRQLKITACHLASA
jgi:hypothetical protein